MEEATVWALALVGYGVSGLLTVGIVGAYVWRGPRTRDTRWVL